MVLLVVQLPGPVTTECEPGTRPDRIFDFRLELEPFYTRFPLEDKFITNFP